MADIVYNPVAGAPFSGGLRMKDLGDGTFAPTSMNVSGLVPLQSLTNVSTTGAGTVLDNTGVRNNHSMIVVSGAGVSAGTVLLEGSQDNVNWFNLLGAGIVSTNAANTIFGPLVPVTTATLTPVRFLRARVSVAITGGTISAWVASA